MRSIRVTALLGAVTTLLAAATQGSANSPRLKARPHPPDSIAASAGTRPLGLGDTRDGQLLVPASYRADHPAPLILALHGAGGSARGPINALRDQAEQRGILVLAVDSRDGTWDAIRGDYDADVEFIDRALEWTFRHYAVDPHRIVVEGFSDGASYALGLGLANGDFFARVIAFSPGFVPGTDSPTRGRPPVFISHGFQDPILPKERTSDIIVPRLKQQGYSVEFSEFQGGHRILPDIVARALDWAGF